MVDTQYGFDGVSIGAIRVTWTRVIGAGAAVARLRRCSMRCCNHTQFGRAMRAIAQNREAALMVGIKPRTVARNAVVLATGAVRSRRRRARADPACHPGDGPGR